MARKRGATAKQRPCRCEEKKAITPEPVPFVQLDLKGDDLKAMTAEDLDDALRKAPLRAVLRRFWEGTCE